jgi:glycerol kinase
MSAHFTITLLKLFMDHIIAIDQGTGSSRCIIYDRQAHPVSTAQQQLKSCYPEPGWVEQDAEEIWRTQAEAIRRAMSQRRLQASDIIAIGITNQRETVIVWDRLTGKPIHNAIVWQDRRTADECGRLQEAGLEPMIQAKTGLIIDPYFSATKIRWILDHVEGARERAKRGELAFGTVDSWLVWNLTRGDLHITDVSNAARTLLYNIVSRQWDEELLNLFDIPSALLPVVKTTSEIYGTTRHPDIGSGIPIAAIAGDQQAALFGQMCIDPGMAKCTYGTGSFLMMNTGSDMLASKHRLLTTIAWQVGDQVAYALEGSVFTGGAVIQWLRDGLRLIERAADCEALAGSVADNGGVVFVPALSGLGAPHWDPKARGTLFGITGGTTGAHIARAAIESICFQVNDLLGALSEDSGRPILQLRIDGGAAMNNLMAQFQADISSLEVIRPKTLESTALGAAYLAGIAVGLWKPEELRKKWAVDRTFHGTLPPQKVDSLTQHWLKAVEKAKNWAD